MYGDIESELWYTGEIEEYDPNIVNWDGFYTYKHYPDNQDVTLRYGIDFVAGDIITFEITLNEYKCYMLVYKKAIPNSGLVFAPDEYCASGIGKTIERKFTVPKEWDVVEIYSDGTQLQNVKVTHKVK